MKENSPILIAPLQLWAARISSALRSNKVTERTRRNSKNALERARYHMRAGDVEAALNIQGQDMKHVFGARRKSIADIRDDLINISTYLDDAWDEIASAPAAFAGDNIGFRLMRWGEGGGMSGEELSAYMIDVKRRYTNWTRVMRIMDQQDSIKICKRICQDLRTIKSVRTEYGLGHETVKKHLFYGLNMYCRKAGWGNFTNT